LTDRETEVICLIAQGFSNLEIASKLSVSEGTIRFHVGNILGKLQLENRTQVALYALRNGLAIL
jgi:DNA-binding NarL/FixJ family response regulator